MKAGAQVSRVAEAQRVTKAQRAAGAGKAPRAKNVAEVEHDKLKTMMSHLF